MTKETCSRSISFSMTRREANKEETLTLKWATPCRVSIRTASSMMTSWVPATTRINRILKHIRVLEAQQRQQAMMIATLWTLQAVRDCLQEPILGILIGGSRIKSLRETNMATPFFQTDSWETCLGLSGGSTTELQNSTKSYSCILKDSPASKISSNLSF